MKPATRSLVPVLAAALIAACDADVLGPNDPVVGSALAARATSSALTTWPVSPSKISMSWADGVANETGWEVHRSTTGATGSFTLRASLPANTTFHTDSTLAPRTEYCYKVRSFRTTGAKKSYATFSEVGCSTTFAAPPAPSNVNAVPRVTTIIDITWTDNSNATSDGESEFRVERAGDAGGPWQIVASLAANTTFYADGNAITPEQQLCYRVIAINPYGESPSTADCTAAPQWPTNMSATSSDAQSIDVSWFDASNVEDGYEVQRRGPDGIWQVAANLPANTNSFHDTGITSDAVYEYRVRATRDGGFSDFSGSVTIAAASRPPDALVLRYVIPGGSTVAHVSWEAESPLATEVRVERSTNGQLSWVAVITLSRPSNLEFYDAGLNPEEEVCYRVFARNALGDSPPSNVDCTRPPAAPSNLTITTVEGGSRLVTWSDNSNIEEGYVVSTYFCSPGGGDCTYPIETVYPPNTISLYLGSDVYGRDEYLEGLCAIYDGGLSDCVYGWNAVVTSGASATRLTNGLPAPRPSLPARQRRITDKPVSARRP